MMDGADSRSPLVALVDEVSRLHGRLRSAFAETRRSVDLGDTELMVLTAVVEAAQPPTVSKIGRSLGYPRQIVQRAANALLADGIIAIGPNPDHKRAALLFPTEKGRAIKRQADATADLIAADLANGIDLAAARDAVANLRGVRKDLESRMRDLDLA
jgi:DNA-binding MarR family transcriptional regulator